MTEKKTAAGPENNPERSCSLRSPIDILLQSAEKTSWKEQSAFIGRDRAVSNGEMANE